MANKKRKKLLNIFVLKQQRIILFSFFFIFSLLTVLLYSKIFTQPSIRKKNSTVRQKIATATPIPDWIETSMEHTVQDDYFLNIHDFSLDTYQNVSCLTDPNRIKNDYVQRDLGDVVESFVKQIEEYSFSDEYELSFDGSTKTINSGKTSQKNISFETFCANEYGYYTLFSTKNLVSGMPLFQVDQVYAAGGAVDPTHFAFIKKDGSGFFLIDKMRTANSINVSWGQGTVYYGCRRLFGSNHEGVLLECAGGDGPGGVRSLNRIDVNKRIMEKLVFCGNINMDGVAQNEVKCFDYSGKEYYRKELWAK